MTIVLFAIAWIITGVIAINLVYRVAQQRLTEVVIENNKLETEEDLTEAKEYVDESLNEFGKTNFDTKFLLLVIAVNVMTWPVSVPVLLYKYNKQAKDCADRIGIR